MGGQETAGGGRKGGVRVGERVEEGERGTREGGRREGREEEKKIKPPLCSNQKDGRADWSSEWNGGGGVATLERGGGGATATRPPAFPPRGRFFFIPFLYLVISGHLSIPDPIFYL
jgi:hypothetical protein